MAKAKTTKKTTSKKTTKPKATKARSTKTTKVKPTTKAKQKETEVPVDRRNAEQERRTNDDRRQNPVEVDSERREPKAERRKVARRRQIDPTTCERDYNDHEIEFMHALDAYKRAAGRMFPTCSEILEVIRDLGYRRLTPEEIAKLNPQPTEDEATPSPEVFEVTSTAEYGADFQMQSEASLDDFEA